MLGFSPRENPCAMHPFVRWYKDVSIDWRSVNQTRNVFVCTMVQADGTEGLVSPHKISKPATIIYANTMTTVCASHNQPVGFFDCVTFLNSFNLRSIGSADMLDDFEHFIFSKHMIVVKCSSLHRLACRQFWWWSL